jgi:hypothetical protein
VKLSGTVLDIEHKAGKFINNQGETVTYDFEILHVLEGREVQKVRLPPETRSSDLPFVKGDRVEDIEVSVPSNTKIIYQP